MNRRQFIASLAGLPVVLKAISTGDFLEAATHREGQLEGWEIVFPDGAVFRFKGFITAMGETSLSVRPQGPVEIIRPEVVWKPRPDSVVSASGTTITRNGVDVGELTEITPPQLTRSHIETDDGELIPGLTKMGDLTFTINFQSEVSA